MAVVRGLTLTLKWGTEGVKNPDAFAILQEEEEEEEGEEEEEQQQQSVYVTPTREYLYIYK